MKKTLVLLATFVSLVAYSQRSFIIVSPKEGSFDPVYFYQGDSILFEFEASGFDSNYVFTVAFGSESQATFKFSDFKNGKFSKKIQLIGSLVAYESPVKITVYNKHVWAWKLKPITDITDNTVDPIKEYKYYDLQGHEKQRYGLVLRSDGVKLYYTE